MPTYWERNELLKRLGYSNYAEYLSSPLWAMVRRAAFLRHGYTCRLCGKIAGEIHHLSYTPRVLTGLDLDQLAPLCDPCHESIEFYPDGTKRMLEEVRAAYARRLRDARKTLPPDC